MRGSHGGKLRTVPLGWPRREFDEVSAHPPSILTASAGSPFATASLQNLPGDGLRPDLITILASLYEDCLFMLRVR